MKQFLRKTTLILIVSCVIVLFIDIASLFCVDKESYYSHERNFSLAYNRLKALKDSTKIVIIAGSNGGFSINSRMINATFHLPVVNTSTHAGIGTRMQFETYKDFLHKGDVVVFCPEYPIKDKRLYGDSYLIRTIGTHLPSAYQKISLSQWLYIYKYIGINIKRSFKHRFYKGFDGPYSAKAVNEYGDIEWERVHKDVINFYVLNGQMDDKLIKYYKYIHAFTKENGIKLLFLPPTLMDSNFKNCKGQIDSLACCLENNGIPWQSHPSIYSFADSLYFDTPYHMTQEGANKRTEILIEDLRKIINCDSMGQ